MRHLACAAALCAALAPAAFASGTATWELNSYADFIRGRFNGLSLSREGRLSLSPKVDTLFTSDQPVIWALAQAPDGALYAATGHRGRLYRIDGAAKSTLLWTAPSPRSSPSPWIAPARSTPAPRPTARSTASRTARPPNTSHPKHATSGRWPSAPMAPSTSAPANRARSSAWIAPATAKSGMRPANRTSPASPSIIRTACSPAPSPTASSIASPPRTRPSSSTTPTCPRSAPSFRCPMARSTPRPSVDPSPSARRAPIRRPKATPAAAPR